jgi:argininosuccinate lyase
MSTTLWGGRLAPEVAAYTAGDDRAWDRQLVEWDIIGTLAHADGLAAIGLLTAVELGALRDALARALADARRGAFTVGDEDEDVHSALERRLVGELGELGEKVHAGRSRNDQVLVDLRLHAKDRLLAVSDRLLDAAAALAALARRHRTVLWPGYTHQRRAMPSSVGLWAAGFAEALLDDLEPLHAVLRLVDRSPLGSAAGFGVPLPLDRALVARRLGFASVQNNVTAVQASRGKLEVAVLAALWQIGYDLAKLAWDVILFSSDELGFLVLPSELATGSSIMPHKRNPDVFELTRARSGVLEGCLHEAMAVAGKLPSGYHRDLQLTKGPLLRGLATAEEMLAMIAWAVPRLGVDRAACAAAVSGDLLSTDEVFRRLGEGEPFRVAYRAVAAQVRSGQMPPELSAAQVLASRTHAGGAGNLGLAALGRAIRHERRTVERQRQAFTTAVAVLVGETGGKL